MKTLWIVLSVFCTRSYSWPADADCLTSGGSAGRCTAPTECLSSYHRVKPILCRYSRGYGTRICCPRFSVNRPYIVKDDHEDLYSDDQPIVFPTESTFIDFHPYIQHTTASYSRNPFYNEESDYRPYNNRPSYHNSRPQYHKKPKPSYTTESFNPLHASQVKPSPSYEYQQRPRPSNGFQARPSFGVQERPDSSRPKPADWDISGSDTSWEYQPERRTTPRPSWALEGDIRRPSIGSEDRRISELKCEEYSKAVSQTIDVLPLSINAEAVPLKVQKCGFSAVKLIVGGEATELGEFPHMAAIGFNSAGSRNILWNCGGTLISERFVMTAGHCVNTTYGNPVVVRLGESNLVRDNDGAEPVDYRVERTIVHPNYFNSLKYNDIALIQLSRSVRFNKSIRPACLPSDDSITGEPIATGWGRTDFAGKLSDILMKVSLSIINNQQCNTFYNTNSPGAASFSSGIVDTMLCAGELEGGRDTCLGDSGGPLSITKKENPCIHYVVGITSFGKICGAPYSPGVYTRVSKYLTWIERIVWS